MKTKKAVYVFFFGILFTSCKQEKQLKEYMINSWQTTYLKIEMPTYKKSDSLVVFEDRFDKNPERIAQSSYKEDGTFSAWFLTKNGEKIEESFGKWNLINDSLEVAFFYGGRNVKVIYAIEKTPTGFKGKSLYDWDEDGDFDDYLIMETTKIN